jgi:phenylpyruvate tautomerase PptA (4-oxalocrotonate tautomerase family)
MPLLEITTNTVIDSSLNIAKKASKLTADLLGKPESYVMVKIENNKTLLFAGNSEPAAHVKLKSLNLPEDKTTDYSASLCSFINTELNISTARIYIEFVNPDRHMWGWNEKTF